MADQPIRNSAKHHISCSTWEYDNHNLIPGTVEKSLFGSELKSATRNFSKIILVYSKPAWDVKKM